MTATLDFKTPIAETRSGPVIRTHTVQRPTMPRRSNESIDSEVFERQAVICRAFAHPKRLQLLDLLGKGEQRVSALQKALGVSRANFSQHLAILKAAGVVSARRKGRDLYCALALPEVKQACHLIREVLRGQLRKQERFEV